MKEISSIHAGASQLAEFKSFGTYRQICVLVFI